MESDAFFFGGFFVAPAAMVFPPDDDPGTPPVSWAITFGAQVPLGDYSSQL